jgi:predicted transposase/invertase (TIGR01784 family)
MENIYEKFLQCSAVSIDTRNCPKDAMFIGIKGANFDGNTFVEKALEQGEVKGKKEIIKNMLENDFDNETISKISNLSIEEIIKIKETL